MVVVTVDQIEASKQKPLTHLVLSWAHGGKLNNLQTKDTMQHAKVVLDEYIDCSVKSLSIRSMERPRLYVLVEVLLIAS